MTEKHPTHSDFYNNWVGIIYMVMTCYLIDEHNKQMKEREGAP